MNVVKRRVGGAVEEDNVSVLRSKNTLWRRVLREALAAGHLIRRPALVMAVQERHPALEEMRPGQLIVVVSGGKPKWAYFPCPGNCGRHVQLSLDLLHPPRWNIKVDLLARPTISPAIFHHHACGAHFTVQAGRVDWVGNNEHSQAVFPGIS